MESVYIGLGSNMGDRSLNLYQGLKCLRRIMHIKFVSSIYETLPMYRENQAKFLNMVVSGNTVIEPMAFLHQIKSFEVEIGREESIERYGPRMIDIDILLFGEIIIETLHLSIPHPLLHEREFVLRPLADVASTLRHPNLNKTVWEMLAPFDEDAKASLHSLNREMLEKFSRIICN